jgi:hypothetical protein
MASFPVRLRPSGWRRSPAILVQRNSQPNCHLANGVRRSVHEVCDFFSRP